MHSNFLQQLLLGQVADEPPDDPDLVWEWARARALIRDQLEPEVEAAS